MSPVYRVENLHKSYGSRPVLQGLDFEVRHGECFCILGRSGIGKSVTLRLLIGLEQPDGGDIRFHGRSIVGLRESELFDLRKRVAVLFQSGALFDSMTVLDNVAFPLREHTRLDERAIAATVREKLSLVGLENIDDQMPSALSGGMRKRVALARALTLDPEVLLLDEPTTGLDPVTAATIGHLISTTRRELEMTSVVVTHNIPLARLVADRIAYLREGVFQFIGSWEEAEEANDRELGCFLEGRRLDEHAA